MMMNRDQADAIAVLVSRLRPEWDVRGIMAALADVRDRDADLVAIAAIRAAMVATNRTPAVIPRQGDHWKSADPVRERQSLAPDQLCRDHARDPRSCPWCLGRIRINEGEPCD